MDGCRNLDLKHHLSVKHVSNLNEATHHFAAVGSVMCCEQAVLM